MNQPMHTSERSVHVIGAGPAGLTAAREMALAGWQATVYEAGHRVGGISRTENYKGYRVDIGGHRFYTKVDEVQQLWREVLGDAFVHRPRLSRIFYDGKFYHYPLNFMDTLKNLGLLESGLSFFSYLWLQVSPRRPEVSFEDWVVNRFGQRLFDKFFRTYTEKVWGISVREIRADWAAQRIQDLSFRTAVWNALFGARGKQVKTLAESFDYPIHGPGMMWEAFQRDVERLGGLVRMNTQVRAVHRDGYRATHLTLHTTHGGTVQQSVQQVISTMALRTLLTHMDPLPPDEVIEAAADLKYRDFIVVCLILDVPDVFPDNWIYIHTPEVHVGRIQNFKNWSEALLPDATTTSLGMEYFCNIGDALWRMSDADLIALATEEIDQLGLASRHAVRDGFVIRQPKAYPVYDSTYQHNLEVIRGYMGHFSNLQTAGRNGLHRYNNQDHSMLTGLLAARNLLGEQHDLWQVNTERSYYESFEVGNDDSARPEPTLAKE